MQIKKKTKNWNYKRARNDIPTFLLVARINKTWKQVYLKIFKNIIDIVYTFYFFFFFFFLVHIIIICNARQINLYI